MPEDSSQVTDLWPDVHFTPMESALLAYLLAMSERVVDADELLREVWGYHPKAQSTTVKSTVRRVRRKIEPEPARPRHLIALRGRGYRLVVSPGTGGGAEVVARRRPTHPAEPTRFVGRNDELEHLAQWLSEGRRLVTVHGGPGLGKTRLVRELTPRVADRYPGGVWFCDLSHATTEEAAFGAVASVLGIVRTPAATSSVVEALETVLGERQATLLVLDNLEQLPSSTYEVLPRLLRSCPSLQLLATSRVRLQVEGEALVELCPLAEAESMLLLRDRIDATRLSRQSPLEESVLRDLSRLLEGVPLALELAAGRARVLPLRELRARLTASFGVLEGQRARRPGRQQTLHQAIEWSFGLLSEGEAAALVQFAAFRGGCSVEVAEQVIVAEPSVLDAITALLDKSMLRSWHRDGALRLGLFEFVREVVGAKGGEALAAARERHARWALREAAGWDASFDADPAVGEVVLRELDNALAAADWLVEQGRSEAVDLLWHLRHSYFAWRLPADYPQRLQRARSRVALSPVQAGRVHLALARVYGLRKEREHMRAEVERGLASAGEAGVSVADLTLCYARVALLAGDGATAIARAERSVALAQEHGTDELLPRHLNVLGLALTSADRVPESVDVFRRALLETERLGALRLGATVWCNLAESYRMLGEPRRGLDCLRRARDIAESFGDELVAHWARAQMAPLHAHLGELEQANALFAAAFEADERFEQSNLTTATRVNAGITALLCGEFARAAALLDTARRELHQRGTRGMTPAICLSSLIICRAALDDLEGAELGALELAELALDALPEPVQTQLHISLGHLDLLRSRRALQRGCADEAAEHRAAAERRLVYAQQPDESAGLAMVRDLLRNAMEG